MPAQSRSRRQRSDAPTFADNPVRLQENKRFFSNQGNNRASREARALTDVFSKGVGLANQIGERKVGEGRVEAITARGAGEDRDESVAGARAQGYNTAWDQLDAESDLNMAKSELPKYLETIDAEKLTEKAFQGVITEFMKGQFEGIDPTSAYGRAMAPGLLKLEQDLLTEHRDYLYEQIQLEQRSQIVETAGVRITEAEGDWTAPGPDGLNVYEYIAEQTDTFFDGANKKTAYWETIYDFAIRAGRPELIENVPEKFADGTRTGINDRGKLADQHRAAIAQATAVRDKADAQALKDLDVTLNDKALSLVVAVNGGATPTHDMIEQYAALPGADATVTAALSKTLVTINGNVDDLAANSEVVGELTRGIYARDGTASQRNISQAYLNGELGEGNSGVNQYQELLSLAKGHDAIGRQGKNEAYDFYLKDIDASYPVQRGPLGTVLNPVMLELNRQAKLEYGQAKLAAGDNFDAAKEWESVKERYDARRDRTAGAPVGTQLTAAEATEKFIINEATVQELQSSGLTPRQVLEMPITEEQKIQLLDGLNTRY